MKPEDEIEEIDETADSKKDDDFESDDYDLSKYNDDDDDE